jgi:hypothetical protein
MTTAEELKSMEGQTAVDVNGAKLGKIGQIYVDDQTRPAAVGHHRHRHVRHQAELRSSP